jgi:hypothetical protein
LILKLREANNDAADYLLASKPSLWAKAHFDGTRFGHNISNVVESVNKTLKLDRELPILQLLDALWNRVMDTRFKRLELATNTHEAERWTPWARGKLQEHRLLARTNTIVMRSELEGLVKQLNGNVYTVDLETMECSYKGFQENGIPCRHAITAIFARPGRDLVPFMPEILSVATWKRTYSDNFPLIDISELQSSLDCHPPLTRVPRGRPKKERYKKEDIRGPRGQEAARQLEEPAGDGDDEVWVPYHCSTCGGKGHFANTCKRPHI